MSLAHDKARDAFDQMERLVGMSPPVATLYELTNADLLDVLEYALGVCGSTARHVRKEHQGASRRVLKLLAEAYLLAIAESQS